MAKEKRSAADLDAELAALEAELAALENKPKAKAKPKEAAPAPPTAAADDVAPASTTEAPKKRRFGVPSLGKKPAAPPAPAPVPPAAAPASAPPAAPVISPAPSASVAPTPPPAPVATYDASVWRQDGEAWVRVVPDARVPVVRRILDENGSVVREEPADLRDVDEASGVKAERGIGRLLRRGK